jgi:hypothetical protein
MTPPRAKTLDERVTDFLRRFAAASVSQHNGRDALACAQFLDAAGCAPTCADENLSLARAFGCHERALGRYATKNDGEETERGYGHGV